MKKFAGFATRHPFLFGFTLIVLFSILGTLTWPITQLYPVPAEYELSEAFTKILIAACFIFMIWRFGWLKNAGVTNLGQKNIWLLAIGIGVYKAILSVYAFSGRFEFSLPAFGLTAAILIFTFSTSLLEETMYRGLLLTAMVKTWGSTRKGLFAAALFSGFFWAGLHFINVLIRPLPIVTLQVLGMAMVGFFYAALVLSGRSIWPAVFIHWITNASVSLVVNQIPDFTETTKAWGISFLANLLLIAVGIYLLQKIDLSTRTGNQETLRTAALTDQTALEEPHGN